MNTNDVTRRRFLEWSAALGFANVPGVLLRAATAAGPDESTNGKNEERDEPALVVVQLSGGNDGLNTVVPYDDDAYHRGRPTLAIGRRRALDLGAPGDRKLGWHPAMDALHEVYGDGGLAVIPGVGYPNPSRSHFRSMDIWHTARPDDERVEDGWLGRALPAPSPTERSPEPSTLSALHVGDGRLPLALGGEVPVPSIQNIDFLDGLASRRGRRMRRLLDSIHSVERSGGAESIRRLAVQTTRQLESLMELRERGVSVDYPRSTLARRLRLTGQLIAGRFANRVYYLSQGGYDTHSRQADQHTGLLEDLSEGLAALYRHLEAEGASRRVVVLVFSEFGRRLAENGSEGTDHGAAGPVFVMSGLVRGGVHGEYPSLSTLEDGDLVHTVDFRRVYATLLERVLGRKRHRCARWRVLAPRALRLTRPDSLVRIYAPGSTRPDLRARIYAPGSTRPDLRAQIYAPGFTRPDSPARHGCRRWALMRAIRGYNATNVLFSNWWSLR